MHQQARRTSEATSPSGSDLSLSTGLWCTLSYVSNIAYFSLSHNIKIENAYIPRPVAHMGMLETLQVLCIFADINDDENTAAVNELAQFKGNR